MIIFDCNGVLVDGERLAAEVAADEFTRAGFPMTPEIVATFQVSFLPGLARRGALRAQIEAVRVREDYRGRRLGDALMTWAFASLKTSPGARAFYDTQRAKGLDHRDALRRLANRLVGILHGCLKTRPLYDAATAWSHRESSLAA